MVDRSEPASSSSDPGPGPAPTILASLPSSSSSSSGASQLSGSQRPLISLSSSLHLPPPPILYDNSHPWLDLEKVYLLQQQEQDAKDLQRLNQETSWLLKCPPEVISWVLFWLADALDIRNLLGTCSLLSRHWVSWDWFELSTRRFPNWFKGASLGDLPDTELHFQRPGLVGFAGQGTTVVSNWKRIFVRDAALRRRLGRPLPSLDPSMHQNNDVANDPTQELPNLSERDQQHLRVLLDGAQYFRSDSKTSSENWRRVSSPVYNIDLDSQTTLSASMLAKKGENADQFEFRVLLYALPNLTDPIAICDSKVWEVDQELDYNVDVARDARRQPQPQEQNNDMLTELAQIPPAPAAPEENALPPATAPQNRSTVNRPWHDPFNANELPVVQLVELKHFFPNSAKTTQSSRDSDKNKNKNRRGHTTDEMKVMFALAFGQNVGEDDMLLLDVWKLLKVVEITLPSILRDQDGCVTVPVEPLPPPVPGRVETIEVSFPEDMRARMVKIYTVHYKETAPASPAPITPTIPSSKEDGGLMVSNVFSPPSTISPQITTAFAQPALVTRTCIAIFGIQNSDASSALMMRKVIFASSQQEGEASLSMRTISRGVSCMTLFPYQSGYDRLLVLYNRHGRGMIWDWVNENQVAQLRMPDDAEVTNARPADATNAPPAGGVGTAVGNVNAAANNNNNNNNAQAGGVSPPNRRRISYWGVQVSFTETPNPFTLDPKERRSFKIVTLADGQDHEWESCFWNVDSLMLGPTDLELPEQFTFVPIRRGHLLTTDMKKARDENMKYIRKWRLDEQDRRSQPSSSTVTTTFTATTLPSTAVNTTSDTRGATTVTTATTTAATTTAATTTTTTTTTAKTSSIAPILYAISKRSEERTLGVRIPMGAQDWEEKERRAWIESVRTSEPVHFNAYVVWNRYRISLTTDQGLVIVDLEEGSSNENDNDGLVQDASSAEPDREWIQYLHHLEDASQNSLVDIATVNNSLVITMKLGHLVWPFYGPSCEQHPEKQTQGTDLAGMAPHSDTA